MFSRVRLLTIGALCALVFVGLSVTSAEAAVAKVGGVTSAGQDYYNAKLKARWKAVPGATYQVRWSASKTGLAKAKPVVVKAASALSPALNRCVTSYVQVRALKGGVAGKWSTPKGLKFSAKRPGVAKLSGVGLDNAVQLKWDYVPYSTRYRVRWNPAPFGKFPGPDTFIGGGWLPQSARSTTLQLPSTPKAGDKMMGVNYANAVFAQIETNNACKPAGLPRSTFFPVFPKAPDPGTGDKVRFATYNVELYPEAGARIVAIADNVSDHNVQVLALQEANRFTAAALQSRLGALWSAVPAINGSGQQILYRNDKFQLTASGSFNVPNPISGDTDMVTPWAKLVQVSPSDAVKSQPLMVVSMHFAENPKVSALSRKAATGAAAAAAIRNINAINATDKMPVIGAGDLRYMREPFCDEPTCRVEAPPTFVRGGFYDAMGAVTKVNFQYTTVNAHTKTNQAISNSGVGTRSDYIMLKGFNGSVRYENVVNRFMPGTAKVTPTDHNMIIADVVIPYTP